MRSEIFDRVESICTNNVQRKAIQRAKAEGRVNESFRLAASALPENLKGDGNALILLYSTLSVGIHPGPTDEECLQLASHTLIGMIALLRGIQEIRNHNRLLTESRSEMAKFLQKKKRPKRSATNETEPTPLPT